MTQDKATSRRDFLKSSALAGGVLAANMSMLANVHAQDNENPIRVGLIGCGGRGTGAAEQCLRGGRNVRLVAMGDAFRDRAESARTRLRQVEGVGDNVQVTDDNLFIGLNAYQDVLRNCDLAILATPPGFRPTHLRAAVAARKHIFTEKPVAVDGPGFRICMAAFEEANRNRLSIVAGTQRRYQTGYIESMQRIHNGDLGTITSARCYWNQGALWHRARTESMTDLEWQIRNWLYFTWLSGDHICEQHVHNLDVMNWALGNSHPTRCVGLGGRQVRTQPHFGHIFDHFAVDYEYPNGVRVMSMCRQIANCTDNISEAVTGTRGNWTSHEYRITGEREWSFPRRQDNNPYQQEHVALIESIRNNRPINDLKNVAESSLTAVMGRMACYTGQAVTWEQAMNSQQNTMPERLSWDMELPVPPVAVPGTTRIS
ncbi:MAG: Gfo/Idh/MocA family oxidoreductase [Planctomycetes bacterium]|nr:Gfo/Idh/MocA family oxidoreductase [Planctomycetota bacterium]